MHHKTINFSERDLQTIYLALRKAPMPFDESAPVIQKLEAFFAEVHGMSDQPSSSDTILPP